MSFSKDFVWGVATSSYQIEGAAQEDGKGLSLWDIYSHQPEKIFEGHNGDIACDHYHRYKEDIRLMAELGVQAYRFSVSWPRVLPQGTGTVNEKGIQFYSDLVDEMLKYGITPYLTLYHWDMPYELYRRGGWMNPDSPKWFAEYAGLIASRLGDRVKNYMTFNEPQVFIGLAFVDGVHAPGHKYGRKETLQMAHHVLLAHGLGTQAVRSSVPDAKIGYAPTSNVPVPVTERAEDINAARRAFFEMPVNGDWSWNAAWWSDPVLLGHYPEDGMKILEADLPSIGQNDMKIIGQPLDFYGQNIYRGVPTRADAEGNPETVPYPIGDPKTAIGWHVNFDCLYWGTKFLYERYKTPIFITENGMSSHDWVHLDGKVHDPQRIDYLHRHLKWLRKSAEEGARIAGYFQWSFMDNFEWARGYNDRFGIVYVDYATQKRIPKDSFYWYKQIIKENGEYL